MSVNKKIAVLAGDGIGPEVMAESLRVLDAIAQKYAHHFNCTEALIGGAAYLAHGSHCPDNTLQMCDESDAILFGSVGGPIDESHLPQWKNCETNSILKIRKHFDFNINIRPIKVHAALSARCPVKLNDSNPEIDLLIFRELTGGIYFGRHHQEIINGERIALDECTYSESQIRSIAKAAFQAARSRNKKLCSVDKANVLATSKLWRDIVTQTSGAFPDVSLTHMLVDNCAMQLVINPNQFDVILTENLFGDILSDLAAALPGSLGLVPSASLNTLSKGLYEPSGGSAPSLRGKGIANPTAQILSIALMLRLSFGLDNEADDLENAVYETFNKGIFTADLSNTNPVSTRAFVDAVISHIH